MFDDSAASEAKLNGLTVVLISFLSAALGEAINWVMIYRTEEYNRLKKNIDSLTNEVEKKKSQSSSSVALDRKKGSQDKIIKQNEAKLSYLNNTMSRFKMKSMVAVAVSLITVFSFMSNHFDGRPVAKLPFEPVSLIRGISQRGLPENGDVHDCAYPFLYLLASIIMRTNLQKALGFTPPKSTNPAAGLFGMPPPQAK